MRIAAHHIGRLAARLLAVGLAVSSLMGAAGATPVDPACETSVREFANPALLSTMRRGVNLPGWDLDDAVQRPSLTQLEALSAHGFTHIRLPLDATRLDEAYLDRMVDQIVFLLSLDYTVSVTLFEDQSIGALFETDHAAATVALERRWQSIAGRLRSFDPAKVAVELLNEPPTTSAVWMKTAAALVADVRRTLPDTTIVVGPAGPQRHETLAEMQPLADPNIVYAVHYYDPFAFTHQGQDWGGEDDPLRLFKGLPFPAKHSDDAMQTYVKDLRKGGHDDAAHVLELALDAPWDAALIDSAFDVMSAWSRAAGRPVIVNEFGVYQPAPRGSRLTWLSTVRQAAEARCIGWMHWDFQDGFGLIDQRTRLPDIDVMKALAPSGD